MYKIYINGMDVKFEFSDWDLCREFLKTAYDKFHPGEIAVRGFSLTELREMRSFLWAPRLVWAENGTVFGLSRYHARKYARIWGCKAGEFGCSDFAQYYNGEDLQKDEDWRLRKNESTSLRER